MKRFYFDWMISLYYFLNCLSLLLAAGNYTSWWELHQFETISHGDYTWGIDFAALFLYNFSKNYLPENRRHCSLIFCCRHSNLCQCKRRRIWVVFISFFGQNDMFVLSILLSSPSGSVADGSDTMPHQTTLNENSVIKRRQ